MNMTSLRWSRLVHASAGVMLLVVGSHDVSAKDEYPAQTVKIVVPFAAGGGSINHLGGELFNSMAGIQANHIPYRGSAPMLTDLIAGRIHFAFDGVSTSLGYIQAGTVRLLGVAGTNRSPIHPDQPTISESALPGFDTTVWFGLFAPAATPKAVVDLLNQKADAAVAAPGVKESLAKLGIETVGGGPQVLAKRVQTEMQKWTTIVREKNIRVDQ